MVIAARVVRRGSTTLQSPKIQCISQYTVHISTLYQIKATPLEIS